MGGPSRGEQAAKEASRHLIAHVVAVRRGLEIVESIGGSFYRVSASLRLWTIRRGAHLHAASGRGDHRLDVAGGSGIVTRGAEATGSILRGPLSRSGRDIR